MRLQSELLSHSMTAYISAAGLFLSFSMMSYMVSDSLGRLVFLNSTLSIILFFGFFWPLCWDLLWPQGG
jgi:hypothetical protein